MLFDPEMERNGSWYISQVNLRSNAFVDLLMKNMITKFLDLVLVLFCR